MPPPLEIQENKQVLVEGNDEVRIFGFLVSHLNIPNIQIRHYGGSDKLRTFLRTLRTSPEFTTVRSLAVVADANSDGSRRDRRIRSALSDMALPTPSGPLEIASNGRIKVAYLVVPHNRDNGMIEDVCLDSVKADPAMECIDRYFECIEQSETPGPREVWTAKARLHAFLSSRDRPGLRIGEAAEAGIWQFEDEAFDPLKALLRML